MADDKCSSHHSDQKLKHFETSHTLLASRPIEFCAGAAALQARAVKFGPACTAILTPTGGVDSKAIRALFFGVVDAHEKTRRRSLNGTPLEGRKANGVAMHRNEGNHETTQQYLST